MVERFFSVPVKLNHSLVFHRLEFRNKTTAIDAHALAHYRAKMNALAASMLPNVCFSILPIDRVTAEGFAAGPLTLQSASAAKLLQNSRRLIIMGSTSPSSEILREEAAKKGDLAAAAFLDAVASETADAGLDFIESLLSSRLRREGAVLTMRFSPGYGDVPLAFQKELFDALHFEEFSVTINERFMMTPQKSVLAFAGI